MAAAPGEMGHEQVTGLTATAMPDLPPYGRTERSRVASTEAIDPSDAQRNAPLDFIEDIQPIGNDRIQPANEPAPVSGANAIVTIPDPKFVTPRDRLGEEPAWIDCPFCHRMAQTRVSHNDSSTTQIYGLLCCICCGIIGVCIPYLCHWAQETDHFCTQCGNRVTHKPNEGTVQVLEPPHPPLVPSRYAEAGKTDQALEVTDLEAQAGEKR